MPPMTLVPALPESAPVRFPCRRCGDPVPAGPLARAAATDRLVFDRACPSCGHRALYRLAEATA